MRRDLFPYLVLPVLLAIALPLMSFPTWVTLTVAGLAMGMMFLGMACGFDADLRA